MSTPTKLAHIVLQTSDVRRACDWWCALLEAHPVWQSDDLAFVTYDDEHHRVAFVRCRSHDPRDDRAPGLHHVAFTFATLPDLIDNYDRLKSTGVVPEHAINHGPTMSLYYRDPDGNRIELQIDCFDDPEDATRYMNGDHFDANPIGVPFDPDAVAARVRSGEPMATIIARPDTP